MMVLSCGRLLLNVWIHCSIIALTKWTHHLSLFLILNLVWMVSYLWNIIIFINKISTSFLSLLAWSGLVLVLTCFVTCIFSIFTVEFCWIFVLHQLFFVIFRFILTRATCCAVVERISFIYYNVWCWKIDEWLQFVHVKFWTSVYLFIYYYRSLRC